MKENFNYQNVPDTFLHCLHAQCPRSSDCLRFLVAAHVDQDKTHFSIVNPGYVAVREECRFFHPARLNRFALGMTHLFDNLPYAKARKIRTMLYNYFDRSIFYRIRNKKRLISPEEQDFIQQVFRGEGIEEEPVFDEYIEQYDL